MMKKALITGITGQDGSYLAEFLLEKGYEVHGMKRRASSFNTARIDHLFSSAPNFYLHYGELTDSSNIIRLVQEIQPDEIYNLGAQSHVKVSFDSPEYTADVDGLGALRLLEAIRILRLEHKTRFYQASTSELFGYVREIPQTEKTPFYPRSPYACAKLYAYWICVNYRESYGIYACNGILFNHESPRRGGTFVTRKITRGLCRVLLGLSGPLRLGNLDALRDWGHARDYVEMQWLMLQQQKPADFVIATGRQVTVRDFLRLAAANLGITLEFTGHGLDEKAIVAAMDTNLLLERYGKLDAVDAIGVGDCIAEVDARYFRPTEVDTLLGDASLARELLQWTPATSLEDLAAEMIDCDMRSTRSELMAKMAQSRACKF